MQVSEFVDGELPENESELLLRRLSQDAELRQLVSQYLEIGRLVRGEPALPQIAELRARIAAELGNEPATTVEEQPKSEGNRFLKPLAGFAVAASVALVAIFSLQGPGTTPETTEGVADTATTYTEPSASDHLNELVRQHEEDYSSNRRITELVTLDIDNQSTLTEVEPKAALLSPVEVQSDVAEDDAVDDEDEKKDDGQLAAE